MQIAPGTLIGNYRVVRLLGEGGMGAVYLGEHSVIGRRAALKVLHPEIAARAELVQRFINEARVAADLAHDHIVGVHDVGMFLAPGAPAAQWYIAFEFLDGRSLGDLIAERRGQPCEPTMILHVLAGTASGLEAAFDKHGIVHRDLKPDNLYIAPTPDDPLRTKVLDFGIAKLREPTNAVKTSTGAVFGTPAYAAPEQLRDASVVDRRADVWALALIAYEMLTGTRPRGPTNSVYEIVRQHAALTCAPDPRAHRPDLDPAIAEVVMRGLDPDPDGRYPSPGAFVRAFAQAIRTPHPQAGLEILALRAKALLHAPADELTIGRRVPQAPGAPTIPERPGAAAAALSISDGVPRAPGTMPMAPSPAAGPISTVSASAGQSVAPAVAGSRRRTPLVAAVAAVGLVGAAVVAAIVLASGGSSRPEPGPEMSAASQESRTAGPNERGTPTEVPLPPAVSAVAVVTEPAGAAVTIDGVSEGPAPLTVMRPVGVEVEVVVELDGFEPAREVVRIGEAPVTVRLTLRRAATAEPAAPDAGAPTMPGGARKGDKPSKHGPKGTGRGSGFSSDDVL